MKGLFSAFVASLVGLGLLFPLILVVTILSLGTIAAQYDVAVLFHTHLNLFISFIVGLTTGELGIIVAVILKVLALLHLIVA